MLNISGISATGCFEAYLWQELNDPNLILFLFSIKIGAQKHQICPSLSSQTMTVTENRGPLSVIETHLTKFPKMICVSGETVYPKEEMNITKHAFTSLLPNHVRYCLV